MQSSPNLQDDEVEGFIQPKSYKAPNFLSMFAKRASMIFFYLVIIVFQEIFWVNGLTSSKITACCKSSDRKHCSLSVCSEVGLFQCPQYASSSVYLAKNSDLYFFSYASFLFLVVIASEITSLDLLNLERLAQRLMEYGIYLDVNLKYIKRLLVPIFSIGIFLSIKFLFVMLVGENADDYCPQTKTRYYFKIESASTQLVSALLTVATSATIYWNVVYASFLPFYDVYSNFPFKQILKDQQDITCAYKVKLSDILQNYSKEFNGTFIRKYLVRYAFLNRIPIRYVYRISKPLENSVIYSDSESGRSNYREEDSLMENAPYSGSYDTYESYEPQGYN
eukprot:gb/GECH01002952.1/.p1 GENE.gb/GECH01002952.1/~~gb/GECH01002952.1/.p1  ORF type:complete len:336 (+),score=21.43 gb/GECH01002952.1/:1-1008(+)